MSEKFPLELSEFELVLVMSGLASLAVQIHSKVYLTPEKREELGKLVERVNEEIVAPAGEKDPRGYDRDTAHTVNRLIEETSLRLLARHGNAG